MADCACDFCIYNNQCPYAYNESDCYVETVKTSKVIVDDEFKTFLSKIKNLKEDVCNENVNEIIQIMLRIINDSEQPLPDFERKEEK